MSACQFLRWQIVVYEDGKWIRTRFWLHSNGLPPSHKCSQRCSDYMNVFTYITQTTGVMLTPRAAGMNLYHFGALCCCSVQNKLKFKKTFKQNNNRLTFWSWNKWPQRQITDLVTIMFYATVMCVLLFSWSCPHPSVTQIQCAVFFWQANRKRGRNSFN